jgi:uncharacterized protein (DUF58 family)
MFTDLWVVARPRTTLYRSLLTVAALALVLVGLLLEGSAALALGLALGIYLGLGYLLCRLPQRGLEVTRQMGESAFEGDRVAITLQLAKQRWPAATLLEVQDRFGASVNERHRLLVPGPLASQVQQRYTYQATCGRNWGVHPCGPVTVVSCDPMGLFHASARHGELATFTVFPQVQRIPGLERLGARATLSCQETTAGRSGQSILNLGVRDYRPGDDLRHIHWPATAHRGEPVLREREVDLHPYLTLFVDLEGAHRAGTGEQSTGEYLVRTAASMLWSAVSSGYMVQMLGEGARPLAVPPGMGQHHLALALQELVRIQPEGSVALFSLVRAHMESLPVGSTALLLGTSILVDGEDLQLLLEELRARRLRPGVILIDGTTFLQVDRWPLPPEEARARREGVEQMLREAQVPWRILGRSSRPGEDLRSQLARGLE